MLCLLLLPLLPFGNKDDGSNSSAVNVDFRIYIHNREINNLEYRQRIYNAASERLHLGSYNDNVRQRSPFEKYVRERVKRFNQNGRFFAIVLDYDEREGSFLVTFSLFVFTAFMNYGSFRESLDYMRDDFNFFFKGVFPADTLIDVSYDLTTNEPANNLITRMSSREIGTIYRQVNILKSIIGIIGILALGV